MAIDLSLQLVLVLLECSLHALSLGLDPLHVVIDLAHEAAVEFSRGADVAGDVVPDALDELSDLVELKESYAFDFERGLDLPLEELVGHLGRDHGHLGLEGLELAKELEKLPFSCVNHFYFLIIKG